MALKSDIVPVKERRRASESRECEKRGADSRGEHEVARGMEQVDIMGESEDSERERSGRHEHEPPA